MFGFIQLDLYTNGIFAALRTITMLKYTVFFVVVHQVIIASPNENAIVKQDDCPCSDPDLCKPLNIVREKETFVFTVSKRQNWRNYHWDKITTISPVNHHDLELMCYAHSKNVSIVLFSRGAAISDPGARNVWVNRTIETVKTYFYDGVTIDYEAAIHPWEKNKTKSLVDTVALLSKEVRKVMIRGQVTMCVAWMPNKAGRHVFGYRELIPHLDFFYVRDYGQGTWGCDNCTTAEANASYLNTLKGLLLYLNITESNKLLLSVPWYGFDWSCLKYDPQTHTCWIKKVYSSDGVEAGRLWKNVKMTDIYETLLPQSFTGRLWDAINESPYFIYKDVNGTYHDVRYDDPQSLEYKYKLASTFNLRGVGMWQPDSLDYTNKSMVNAFWDQLPSY